MKNLIALIVSGALVISSYGQTRSVLVGTNGVVVAPTNFWSVNSSNATAGIGLGTAATNPASAFQSSSSVLSNLASSNGVNLTNIPVAGVVGALATNGSATNLVNFPASLLTTNGNGGGLTNLTAANITGTVGLASNVTGTIAISNGGTGATNAGEARTNLGATSVGGSLFTATNVTHARNILGMGGDGLNSSIGGGLSNIASGSQSTVSGGSFNSASEGWATVSGGANNSATNFYSVVSGGSANVAGGLNSMVAGGISSEAIGNYSFAAGRRAKATNAGAFVWADSQNENFSSTNSDSFNVRAFGGMSLDLGTNGISFRNATNAAISRTNLGLGLSALTNTNNSSFRTAIELPLSALTNTSNAEFNIAIGLGTTNNVQFNTVRVTGTGSPTNLGVLLGASNGLWGSAGPPSVGVGINGTTRLFVSETAITASAPIGFDNTTNAATTRTNLGLGWSGLTNTNGTGLVAVNTNGEVVSPTNFWQVSPANTRVQLIQPVVNATNTATNARNLFLYSLAISTTGVTNTIQLPTNGTFLGDVATVIHEGPTSSITAVRQIGSGTNIVTLNQFQEAVKFIYEADGWRLADNLSFVEAIYFSGTNAAAHAAESRTNLGLGATWLTNTNVTNFRSAIGLGATNTVTFGRIETDAFMSESSVTEFYKPIWIGDSGTNDIFQFEIGATDQAKARTNLGLGAGSTNEIGFGNVKMSSFGIDFIEPIDQEIVFRLSTDTDPVYLNPIHWNDTNVRTSLGLGAANNVTFSNVTASGTLTATSTVTAKTNLVVEGFVDFTTNRTNSNPATNNQINDFIEIRVGTNQFWLPVYK